MKDTVNTQVTPLEKLLNMDQASDILGVSKSTLYSWICQKKIRVVKAGSKSMFKPSDVWDYIQSHTVEPIKVG